ncbi:hypothetical protein [Paraferrimonas sedimenticola]|uniref:Lipoprotein n=1 Tax=Paraferrimonas sedimenticola TaxID=375674 RepID=A0AA37RTQ4_9GAMM|nr:hypothetical protein [Paraferrimonas sedimenticola]GLP95476.1 hypothetical protein GCM10007895_07820 [Paraferrimonas sedimenticola]
MKTLIVASAFALILTGCASAPNWENMTQTEINDWKTNGYNAEQADRWHELGQKASEAKAWEEAGFNTDSAKDWIAEKFTSEEASAWKKAGFDVSEAVRDRSRGLQPIR